MNNRRTLRKTRTIKKQDDFKAAPLLGGQRKDESPAAKNAKIYQITLQQLILAVFVNLSGNGALFDIECN